MALPPPAMPAPTAPTWTTAGHQHPHQHHATDTSDDIDEYDDYFDDDAGWEERPASAVFQARAMTPALDAVAAAQAAAVPWLIVRIM